MVDLDFERPTEEAVDWIAENLRTADRDELRAYGVWNDDDEIEAVVRASGKLECAQVAHIEGEPVVLFGLQEPENFWEPWTPWLFATHVITKYPVLLTRQTRDILSHWRSYAPWMQNYVWEGNTAAIDWLEASGFYLDPARYRFKPRGAQFVRFIWRDLSCVRPQSSPLASLRQ